MDVMIQNVECQSMGHGSTASSHNGFVTVISLDTQKCLDVEVLSDKCQQCQKWGEKIQDPRYNA